MTPRAPTLAFTALLSLAACAPEPAPAAPASDLAPLAEQAVRALAEGLFEVLELHPRGVVAFEFVDDFRYRTRLHALELDGRVRCAKALSVEMEGDLDEHIGEPGWTMDDSDRGLSLLALLGPGDHAAGQVISVRAAAVFDELSPGHYRFRILDRPRAATPR